MAFTSRLSLVKAICRLVRIARGNPSSEILSKRELERVHSVLSQLEARGEDAAIEDVDGKKVVVIRIPLS